MAALVRRVKEISTLLGSGEKVIQASEQAIINLVRRSIVARHDLPAGATIGWNDITWVRPAGGLPPGKENLVLGKTLARSVSAGEPLTVEILSEKSGA
jgi:sialic acid synthase SpsE